MTTDEVILYLGMSYFFLASLFSILPVTGTRIPIPAYIYEADKWWEKPISPPKFQGVKQKQRGALIDSEEEFSDPSEAGMKSSKKHPSK